MDFVPASVIDALTVAGESDAELCEVSGVPQMGTACVTVCHGGEGVSLMTRISSVVALLRGLAPHERAQWEGVLGTLETLAPLSGGVEDGSSATAEVVGLAELADVALIFEVANRAAPHARDLVGRFYRKSIEQRCFFRDVCMTTAHLDELVSLTAPHLQIALRGPVTIPPTLLVFSVLFWLAQGGPQRVIARAIDVVESTFSKICSPVVQAMLAALPLPSWPNQAERRRVTCEFSNLRGGDAVGWEGQYVLVGALFLFFR